MFDIGWMEVLMIAAVAIVVVGPKDLPDMLRNLGRGLRAVRRMASDFQGQFNDALKEAELDEVRDEFNRFRSSARSYTNLPNFNSIARDEIKGAIEGKPSTTPSIAPPDHAAAPLAALPEAQLPVMQEPIIDLGTPAPMKKARKPAKPKSAEEIVSAKTKATAKTPVKKPAKPRVTRKADAKPSAPSSDDAS